MTDVTNKDLMALFDRLNLTQPEEIYGETGGGKWTDNTIVTNVDLVEDDGTLQEFVYRLNRIMDRLDATDAQATRWRTQRDEALAKVEALEKQNDAMAKELVRLNKIADHMAAHDPYTYNALLENLELSTDKIWEVVCQHDQTLGTADGWLCTKCGHIGYAYSPIRKPIL